MLAAALVLPALPRATVAAEAQPAPLGDKAVGQLMDRYATIAGGWYLEERCRHLDVGARDEFKWSVARLHVTLSRAFRGEVSADFFHDVQRVAEKEAGERVCGEQTRELVEATLAMSRRAVRALTGVKYSPVAKALRDLQRLSILLASQAWDDRCRIMPTRTRAEFDDRVRLIVAGLERTLGPELVADARTDAAALTRSAGSRCDDRTDEALRSAYSEAQRMANAADGGPPSPTPPTPPIPPPASSPP